MQKILALSLVPLFDLILRARSWGEAAISK